MIKPFADTPRLRFLFHRRLQISTGHIQANGIAPDMLGRIGYRDVFSSTTHRNHELHLMMEVLGH